MCVTETRVRRVRHLSHKEEVQAIELPSPHAGMLSFPSASKTISDRNVHQMIKSLSEIQMVTHRVGFT